MLGDAQTVVDAGRAALGVEPGRPADFRRVETGEGLLALRRVPLIGDEPGPGLELGEVATLADIGLVDQPSVTITCASELMKATLEPGFNGR